MSEEASLEKMSEEASLLIQNFLSDLKQRQIVGSSDTAIHMVLLLRKLVGSTGWRNVHELIALIKEVATQISERIGDSTANNMIYRVLKLVREECTGSPGNESEVSDGDSLQTIMFQSSREDSFSSHSSDIKHLKSVIIDSINEVLSELETCRDNISMQALEHIHSNEIIMTYGKSRTVEKFLKNAARKRKFTVIVAECAPYCEGQELAKTLSDSNIETTVITDSAVFAIMSRVNKVIIGTHAVMADGGLKATSGVHAIALAAKHHSVPLIVCTGLFKLSPQFVCTYDQDIVNQFLSPSDVLKLKDGKTMSNVHVVNPLFDYIEADLVTMFITDVGGSVPSYMYRLLVEMYQKQDTNINIIT